MNRKITGILSGILLIAIDQITKVLAVLRLKEQSSITLIPGVLEFHYLENQSAAFSIDPVSLFQRIVKLKYFQENPAAFLQAKMLFFLVFTVLIVSLLFLVYLRVPAEKKYLPMNICLIFFISGAIGNLIDRMTRKYVVDFIYFSLIDFPVFNVADIYVTCAAILLVIILIFYYKEEDLDRIIPAGKK